MTKPGRKRSHRGKAKARKREQEEERVEELLEGALSIPRSTIRTLIRAVADGCYVVDPDELHLIPAAMLKIVLESRSERSRIAAARALKEFRMANIKAFDSLSNAAMRKQLTAATLNPLKVKIEGLDWDGEASEKDD